MDKELEFKFGVQDGGAFERLVRHLGLEGMQAQPSCEQRNHFFDTPEHALQASFMCLRLREESGEYLLTFKGNQERVLPDGCATQRTEIETRLSASEAEDLLAGTRSALDLLLAQVTGERASALDSLRALLVAKRLECIGSFKNRRTRLAPIELKLPATSISLCFELDQCEFAAGGSDFEIEVEVPCEVNLEQLEQALYQLLRDAGIQWHTCPSKSQRFYAQRKRST